MGNHTHTSRMPDDDRAEATGRQIGRRPLMKAAIAGSIALGSTYVQPEVLSLGVQSTYAASAPQLASRDRRDSGPSTRTVGQPPVQPSGATPAGGPRQGDTPSSKPGKAVPAGTPGSKPSPGGPHQGDTAPNGPQKEAPKGDPGQDQRKKPAGEARSATPPGGPRQATPDPRPGQ